MRKIVIALGVLFSMSNVGMSQESVTVYNEKYCGPGTVTLSSITGACSNFKWYNQANGGTLLGTGCSYTDPTATFRQRYFVTNPTITSTDPNCATFEWFDSPTSNTPIATGCSFTEPGTDVKGVYFYSDPNVMGISTFGYTDGDLPNESAVNTTPDQGEKYVSVFDAKQDFVLNSINIKIDKAVWSPAPTTLVVELRNNLGQLVDSYQPTNLPTGNGTGFEVYTIPVNFTVPAGNDYTLKLINVRTDRVFVQTGGADYSVGGPLDNLIFHIKSYGQAHQWVGGPLQADYYSGMFDWNISALGLKQTFYNTRSMVIAEDTCNIICGEDIDLNTWSIGGDATNGDWEVSVDGKSVTQNINGRPTFFISPEDFINVELTGSFTVNDAYDNDFAGFVFGYEAPLTDVITQKYYLFDWKMQNQGNGVEGFTLNEVDMIRDMSPINHTRNSTDYWDHIDQPGFSVIEKFQGPNTGWARNQKYKFTLTYTSTRIVIVMDGGVYSNDTIIDRTGCFEPGRFGFYNFSQENVTYADFSYKLTADYQVVYPEVCVLDSGNFVAFDSLGGSCGGGALDLATNVVKWDWDFGDGNSGDGGNVKHKYANSGYYDVLLQVTDSIGCTANVTKRIKVLIQQDAFLNATPDTLCEGDSARIAASSILDSYYEWFRDGISLGAPTQNDSVYFVKQTGTYYAQLSGNPEYCDAFTDSAFYLFKPLPVIVLSSDNSCPNADSLVFTAPYYSDMIYDWVVVGATFSKIDSNKVTYNVATTQVDFSLIITDTLGCESLPAQASVTLQAVGAIAISPTTNVCEGDTVNYSVPNDGGTYAWGVNNSSSYTVSNTSVEVIYGSQDVDITVEKTGGTGCKPNDSIRIVVNPLPVPVITGPLELCEDEQGIYASTNTGTLTWSASNASSLTSGSNVTISNFASNQVVLVLNVVDGNSCVGDTTFDVKINELPTPVIAAPNKVCSGTSLTSILSESYTSIAWNVLGAANFTDYTDSLIVESATSNIDISVSVVDSNGCEADTVKNVIVDALPNTQIDNPVTQVCDGNTFTYSPVVSAGSVYTWQVDTASFIVLGNSIDVTFDGSSTIWIYLDEVDVNSCEGKDSVEVNKQSIPNPTISGEINPCENTIESYSVAGSGGIMTWDLLTGMPDTSSVGGAFDLTFNSVELVRVSVTEDANGCVAYDTFDIQVRKNPVVSLSAPISVCVNESFSVNSTHETGTLSWVLTGSTFVNKTDSLTVDASATAVDVSLIETSSFGCEGGDTVTVLKNALPSPVFDNPNLSLCPQSDELYEVVSSVGSSYSWNVKDEQFTDKGDSVKVTNVQNDFWVIVNEIDVNGCKGSDSIEVSLVKLNPIVISGKRDVCIDEVATYQSTNNNGVLVWSNESGSSVIADNLNYSADVTFSTLNSVVLKAEETVGGCVVSDTHNVIVHAIPVLTIGTVSSVCLEGGAVAVNTNVPSGIISGVGIQGAQFNPKASGVLIGQANWMYFNYTDQFGCSNIDSTSIIVYEEPSPVIALVEPVVCVGQKTTIYETSTTVGNKTWSQGSVVDTFIVSGSGAYQLTVENMGCVGKSNIVNVRTESASVDLGGDFTVKYGAQVRMTADYSSDVSTIEWFDSLGNVVGTDFDLILKANVNSCFEATVKTSIGCEAVDRICFEVLHPILPMQVFSPNNDGVNETWVVDYITDYPRSVVKVFNRFGNVVYEDTGYQNDWDGTRNGELVPMAVYYYVIDLMDGSEVIGGSVTIIY